MGPATGVEQAIGSPRQRRKVYGDANESHGHNPVDFCRPPDLPGGANPDRGVEPGAVGANQRWFSILLAGSIEGFLECRDLGPRLPGQPRRVAGPQVSHSAWWQIGKGGSRLKTAA